MTTLTKARLVASFAALWVVGALALPPRAIACSAGEISSVSAARNPHMARIARFVLTQNDLVAHYATMADTEGRMSIVLKSVRELQRALRRIQTDPALTPSDQAQADTADRMLRRFSDPTSRSLRLGRERMNDLKEGLAATKRFALEIVR